MCGGYGTIALGPDPYWPCYTCNGTGVIDMTYEEMKSIMEIVFSECQEARQAGQKEYAHDQNNAFANFERIANDTGVTREQILWVYAMKHRDGIASYLKGHKSQREDVRGRIKDLIVYLCLLRGMIEENELKK